MKPAPQKRCTDSAFKYVTAKHTDIRETFKRVREQMASKSGNAAEWQEYSIAQANAMQHQALRRAEEKKS